MDISTFTIRQGLGQKDCRFFGQKGKISFGTIRRIPGGYIWDDANVSNHNYDDNIFYSLPQIYVTDMEHIDEVKLEYATPAAIICTHADGAKAEDFMEFNVPVFVPANLSIDQACQHLLSTIIVAHMDDGFFYKLNDLIKLGEDLQTLLGEFSRYVHKPVSFSRDDYKMIANTFASFKGEDQPVSEILDTVSADPAILNNIGVDSSIVYKAHSVHFTYDDRFHIIAMPVLLGTTNIGYVCEYSAEVPNWRDYNQLELFVNQMLAYFRKNKAVFKKDETTEQRIMKYLIKGTAEGEDIPKDYLAYGSAFDKKMCLLQVKVPDKRGSRISLEGIYQQLFLLLYRRRAIEKSRTRGVIIKDNIFILCELDYTLKIPNKTRAEMEKLLQKNGFKGACSNSFSNIFDLGKFSRQTEKLFELAAKNTEHALVMYSNNMFAYILSFCEEQAGLDTLCVSELNFLLDYDRKNNSDYYNTLRIYLEYNGNLAKSARKIGIHYNSLKYRIEVIQEQSGIDLHDSETLLNLRISYLIMDRIELKNSKKD